MIKRFMISICQNHTKNKKKVQNIWYKTFMFQSYTGL